MDHSLNQQPSTTEDRGLLVEGLSAITRPARKLLRKFGFLTERWLHPFRRRRTVEAVRRLSPSRQVLFICLGNICRSPYAAGRFERLVAERPDAAGSPRPSVVSAGFVLPGRAPPTTAVDVAGSLGLDLGTHRSQVFDDEMIAQSDVIVVMTSKQEREIRDRYGRHDVVHLGDLDPQPISQRDIPDPLDQPEKVFRQVYQRIDRALGHLGELLLEEAMPRAGSAFR